jgi:hypothetical protein
MKISRGAGYFFSCSKDRGATFKKKIIEFDPFLAKLEKIIFIWEFLRKKKIEIFLKDYKENLHIPLHSSSRDFALFFSENFP